jgi:hypothetical protein
MNLSRPIINEDRHLILHEITKIELYNKNCRIAYGRLRFAIGQTV